MRQADGFHRALLFFCGALLLLSPLPRLDGQQTEFKLRSEVDLLSVAVRVTDRKDNEIHGLTANQFNLYEDGIPQKISFFDAANEPVSLGILLDVSGSMAASGKLGQAKEALARLLGTMRPEDEMFFLRFDTAVQKVVDFTGDRSRVLAAVSQTTATENSTRLYDAIARALCIMRQAYHHRQALVVVTDGTDQNSHRSLEDLIPIVQASQAQVFIMGCLDKQEYDAFRSSRRQKIPLVTRQEVDNPLTAFDELAKESGAESFFPSSPARLQEALDAVAHQLRTQYTLAYYPKVKGDGFHRIEVKVAQSGVRVRRGFAGTELAAGGGTSAPAAGCENEKLKPYPYESKVTTPNGCTIYRDDFRDASSGWPNREGYHYRSGTYEIVNAKPQPEPGYEPDSTNNAVSSRGHAREVTQGAASPEATLVANGPLFADFTASVNVEWKSGGDIQESGAAAGLVFRLHNRGYYAVILSRDALKSHLLAFKLVKKFHAEPIARDVLPWTELPSTDQFLGKNQQRISVQCRGTVIQILFQDTMVAKVERTTTSKKGWWE